MADTNNVAANGGGMIAWRHMRSLAEPGRVLAFVLFSGVAIAQTAPAPALRAPVTEATAAPPESPLQTTAARPASEIVPSAPPKISFVDGLLRIEALGSTLADVLTKVAALAGVTIDVPAGARTERMPVVDLGPGPPREILASLLSDSNFDYLIQGSDTDPLKIQSVLLMPREKKGSGTNGVDPGARPRSPYVRAAAQPAKSEEAPVSENPVPPQPENAVVADPNAAIPPPVSTQADDSAPPPPPQPEQSMQLPLSQQTDQSNLMKPAPLTPPQNLSPQSINQQLQQMYQQRMQMIQQGQTVPPTVRQ